MILDEPTNHLDLAAKQWLMDELGLVPREPAGHLPRLEAPRPVDRQGPPPGRRPPPRVQGHLLELPHPARRRPGAQRAGLHPRGREIKRLSTLADSMRGSTNRRARIAKSLDKRVERLEGQRTEVFARERKSTFRLPAPRRSAEVPLEVASWPCATTTSRCSSACPSGPAGGTASWSSAVTGPASRAFCAAWPAPRSDRRVGGHRGEHHHRLLRPGARAGGPRGSPRWPTSTTRCW